MNTFTINILQHNTVINKTPYLYVSKDLKSIITEIRKLTTDLIKDEYNKFGISFDINDYNLSMCIFTDEPINIHFTDIKFNNIKEIKQLIIDENTKKIYNEIMGGFVK